MWLNKLIPTKQPSVLPNTALYNTAEIRPEKIGDLYIARKVIVAGKQRYEALAQSIGNGIPWWFIGITHFMEIGHKGYPKNFGYHLHCGDSLTARTTHVPKGRPKFNPKHGTKPPSVSNPYSWEESARDALELMNYTKVKDWSIENCLTLFEKFNGLGYKRKGLLSPYVWSFTTLYSKGKYVTDRVYDPNAVSSQPGTAAIMKILDVQTS